MATVNIQAKLMADEALKAWGLQSSKRELVSISENIVFRIDAENEEAFRLCLHRSWYHNLEELDSERIWTHALRNYGISTPIPVPALNGRDYVPVRDALTGEIRYASMNEWVGGETMHDVIMRSKDFAIYFKQLGKMAAQIHNQASRWQPPAKFRRHSLDADGLMGTSPWWGRFWEAPRLTENERRRFKHLRETIHGRLSELDKHPGTYSMIHSDLAPGNIVIDEGNLHIIDFDDAAFGWHIYELATGVYPYQEHPRFPEIISAVFEGYRELRHLSTASASLLKQFMLIRALSLIGWRAARPELLNQPEWSRGSKWTINKALSLSADIGL